MPFFSVAGSLDAVVGELGSAPLILGYLDAGTGSIVFQWVIAGLVGGAFVIKMSWRRFVGLFKRQSSASEESDDRA